MYVAVLLLCRLTDEPHDCSRVGFYSAKEFLALTDCENAFSFTKQLDTGGNENLRVQCMSREEANKLRQHRR